MNTFGHTILPLKLAGAVLGLAIVAAIAVAITLTVQPTQAQNADNSYADPQPCGPGAETAFQPEPHEITAGHFALFDAYWQPTIDDESTSLVNTGVLHTNECPPQVVKTTETGDFGQTTTVTTLSPSGIDVDEAIFHVLDKHEATVVASASENPTGTEISLAEYGLLDDYVYAGDQVWWLRLDDPDTADVDETSDLALGFSTMRFDGQHWATRDGSPPLRYKFELERNPGIDPAKHPHFLAFKSEDSGGEVVWDSAKADTVDMMMEPGQLEDLQWVFTKPGTYEIWVHLQGWVRRTPPPDAGDDWAPISDNITETSEIKRYVIQVGSALAENEPPVFGLDFTVPENSPADTPVGDPISVFADAATLHYSLAGDGHELFALESQANPHTVQVKVADGANLDYEAKSSYNLTLNVTDELDHESNPDPTIDDTLVVRVGLENVPPYVKADVDNATPAANGTVHFTAEVGELPLGAIPHYDWLRKRSDGFWESAYQPGEPSSAHWSTREPGGTSNVYQARVRFSGDDLEIIYSEEIRVTWSNP